MGFFRGVVTGVAVAAGVAAWYMSRSGERVREQYRVEERLGVLGDQIEARTREIQGTLNAQLAEMRAKSEAAGEAASASTPATSSNGHDAAEALDNAAASAAEAAAEVAAEAEARTVRIKRAADEAAGNVTD